MVVSAALALFVSFAPARSARAVAAIGHAVDRYLDDVEEVAASDGSGRG
jgi:hypothetical protein